MQSVFITCDRNGVHFHRNYWKGDDDKERNTQRHLMIQNETSSIVEMISVLGIKH